MSTKIIHISDIHGGRTDSEMTNFEGIINKIVTDYSEEKPIIIITGDIVDDGEVEQYAEAQRILDKLNNAQFRVLLIPGNHDYGQNGNHAKEENYHRFKSTFSKFFKNNDVHFPYEDEFGGHVFIGLNSMMDVFKDGIVAAPEDGIFSGNTTNDYDKREVFFASGKLGEDQISNTLKILKKYEDRSEQKVILYLHHHPFDIKGGFIHRHVHSLVDGEDFLKKISGRVDLLLFGHEHIHIDFSETHWSTDYNISKILCSGKSTGGERAKEGTINYEGKIKETDAPDKLIGRMIEITSGGEINPSTIDFKS